MHGACLLEIHGIQGSALVTYFGSSIFHSQPVQAVTQHYTYPWISASPGQQQRVILGHIVDPEATLGGEPGVAAPSPSAVDGYFGAV